MTAQIRGMGQAIRNANDGISLAQVAEGALGEVTNMLQRVRELAVQSASGTYSAADRTNLNVEGAALQAQIASILTNTKFNGVSVFDYAATDTASDDITIQVGANAENVALVKSFLDSDNFEAADFSVSTAAAAATTITNVDANLTAINSARAFAGRQPEPSDLGGQRSDQQRHQPVRRAVADRGRRFLGRVDQPRQGADPEPGGHRHAGPGQPVPAGRAEPPPLTRIVTGSRGARCVLAHRAFLV